MKMKIYPGILILFILFLLFSVSAFPATYYVSAEGNDEHSGMEIKAAWKTIDRVNKLVPKPGDSILFRRGDEWVGTITANMWGLEGRQLFFGAYGNGPKPKIYGSEKITGWSLHSGNIYKARVSKPINQLFAGDDKMKAARHPNKGYLFITSVTGDLTITADGLSSKTDYTGARWFGRTNYFSTSLLEIQSSGANSLTFNDAPRFPLKPGLGFFMIGRLEFLDQPGEWYYDEKTETVYLWTPDGKSPENYTIRGSVHPEGMLISGKSYITIQDLHFLQQSEKGIHLRNSNNIVINNNDFSWQDGFGIYSRTEAENYKITGNSITGVNHYGMYLRISNSYISDNNISKVALFDNIGISGTGEDNFGGGIYLAGEKGNNVVRYNRLNELGFTGILFARPGNIIEYNYIKDVCLLKGDMGAIYTSWYKRSASSGPEGSIIRNNIIINVVGEKYGYTSKRHMGEGIYIDESAIGVLIENNTIAYCTNSGIKLHRTENVKVINNTIVDARQSIQILKSEGMEKNTIQNNLLVSVRNQDDYLKRQVLINASDGRAVYDFNEYVCLHDSDETFIADGSTYSNFGKWKLSSGNESNSRLINMPMSPGEKEILYYNDSKREIKINTGNNIYRDINGKRISGEIILQPFTSILLIGSDRKKSGT